VTLLRIHRANPAELQFKDVLVSSAILLFRKAIPSIDHETTFSLGGTLSAPTHQQQIKRHMLNDHSKWTQFPILTRHTSKKGCNRLQLGDLFDVKRGVVTGERYIK
jgi:hypothetical protein